MTLNIKEEETNDNKFARRIKFDLYFSKFFLNTNEFFTYFLIKLKIKENILI
jgi:hypothetical protein